jgi:copper(I)-binding protein
MAAALTRRLFLSGALLACTAAVLAAQGLSVSDAWIKLPADGGTQAVAVATVSNPAMYDAYLVSADSDVAAEVQFRQAAKSGDAQPIKEVTVPAFDKLEMQPTGVFMLLSGLKRPLTAGESITVTLTTDAGATLQVSATVRR